jgi:hypothetical protein
MQRLEILLSRHLTTARRLFEKSVDLDREIGGIITEDDGFVELPSESADDENRVYGIPESFKQHPLQWHTHPDPPQVPMDRCKVPSGADLALCVLRGTTEFVLTELGVWIVKPIVESDSEDFYNDVYIYEQIVSLCTQNEVGKMFADQDNVPMDTLIRSYIDLASGVTEASAATLLDIFDTDPGYEEYVEDQLRRMDEKELQPFLSENLQNLVHTLNMPLFEIDFVFYDEPV